MTAGSGMTYSDLLAEWKHGPSCSSKTCQGCCLQTTGTLWPESFTAWPTSATTSHGGLFQQQPLEHPINASAGGDLPTLKTPTANLGNNGGSQHPDKRKAGGHGPTLADEIEHLLPTPTASQPGGTAEQHLARKNKAGGNRKTVTDLGMVVEQLLPTPLSRDWKDGKQNPNVPINGILSRTVWQLDSDPTQQQLTDGKK